MNCLGTVGDRPETDRVMYLFAQRVRQELTRRWPGVAFSLETRSGSVRWVDGPGPWDVRETIRQVAQIEPDAIRDRAVAIRPRREFSARVVAFSVLAFRALRTDLENEAPDRGRPRHVWPMSIGDVIDDLRAFPVHRNVPPPVPGLSADHGEDAWEAARTLAELTDVPPAVPVHGDRRADLDALLTELDVRAALAGTTGLRRFAPQRPENATSRWCATEQSGSFPCSPNALPDLDAQLWVTAKGDGLNATLAWLDGPTAAQVEAAVTEDGLPDPYAAAERWQLGYQRVLSPISIAVSLILYRRVKGRCFDDPTCLAHWMQLWKIPSVREQHDANAARREQLASVQATLDEHSLPLRGPVTVPQLGEVGGDALWEQAIELAATLPGVDHDLEANAGQRWRIAQLLADIQRHRSPVEFDALRSEGAQTW